MLNNHPHGTIRKRDIPSKGGKGRKWRESAGDFPVTVTRSAPRPQNLTLSEMRARALTDLRPAW